MSETLLTRSTVKSYLFHTVIQFTSSRLSRVSILHLISYGVIINICFIVPDRVKSLEYRPMFFKSVVVRYTDRIQKKTGFFLINNLVVNDVSCHFGDIPFRDPTRPDNSINPSIHQLSIYYHIRYRYSEQNVQWNNLKL